MEELLTMSQKNISIQTIKSFEQVNERKNIARKQDEDIVKEGKKILEQVHDENSMFSQSDILSATLIYKGKIETVSSIRKNLCLK